MRQRAGTIGFTHALPGGQRSQSTTATTDATGQLGVLRQRSLPPTQVETSVIYERTYPVTVDKETEGSGAEAPPRTASR